MADVPLRCIPTTSNHGPTGMVDSAWVGGGAFMGGDTSLVSAQTSVHALECRGAAR